MSAGHGRYSGQRNTEEILTGVIEAVADHKSVDSMSLEQPLYEAIDPDALQSFLEVPGGTGESATRFVEFHYDGCRVRVRGDRSIDVVSISP